jgi:LacI family gluconate utilization system Gnt-I transcriptional repressor
VQEETRRRIAAAIEAEGYVPNLVAGGLASNRSNVVAALFPNMGNPLFAMTLRGFSDVLRRNGFYLMVGNSAHSQEEEEQLVKAFLSQRPCGIFLHETMHNTAARQFLRRAGVPIVEVGDLIEEPMDVVVSFSNYEATKAMTRHIASRGYRQIALVTSALSARSAERRRGYVDGLAEAGLPLRPEIIDEAFSDFGAGGVAIAAMLEAHPEVDAVLFMGNSTAVGALFECQRRGWDVPGRVAIACLDDNDLVQQTQPPLAAIRIPRYEIGVRAAEVLLALVEGRGVAERRVDLGFELIERASIWPRPA